MTRFVGLFIAAVLVATVPTTSVAGEEYEEVVVRLTLQGPVPATDTFAIRCVAIDDPQNPCFGPESIVIVCSPPDDVYAYRACEAKTYEFVTTPFVGQTIDYSVLRWTTPDLSHTDDQLEEHLHGSWVVREGRQVIALGYVYPGETPSQPSASPVLPDTALPSPRDQ